MNEIMNATPSSPEDNTNYTSPSPGENTEYTAEEYLAFLEDDYKNLKKDLESDPTNEDLKKYAEQTHNYMINVRKEIDAAKNINAEENKPPVEVNAKNIGDKTLGAANINSENIAQKPNSDDQLIIDGRDGLIKTRKAAREQDAA